MKKTLLYIVCLLFIAPAKINAQNKISPAMQAPGIASFVSAPESTTARKSRERSQSNSAPQRVNAHPMRMAGAPLTAPITGFFSGKILKGGFHQRDGRLLMFWIQLICGNSLPFYLIPALTVL